MGRLRQTLILSRWKPLLAWLPVETVIRETADRVLRGAGGLRQGWAVLRFH